MSIDNKWFQIFFWSLKSDLPGQTHLETPFSRQEKCPEFHAVTSRSTPAEGCWQSVNNTNFTKIKYNELYFLFIAYELLSQKLITYLKQLQHIRLTNENSTIPLGDHDDVSRIWTSLFNECIVLLISYTYIDKCQNEYCFYLYIVVRKMFAELFTLIVKFPPCSAVTNTSG